jgi:hypothetical protein
MGENGLKRVMRPEAREARFGLFEKKMQKMARK